MLDAGLDPKRTTIRETVAWLSVLEEQADENDTSGNPL